MAKKVLALVLTLILVFSLVPGTVLAAAGDAPAHSKTISSNGDGTYKIELTVTGDADDETESDSHINVLIIYDESSSMVSSNDNPRRADIAEDAMYTFVNGLIGYKARGVDIYMAEVGFGTGVNTRTNWTDSLTTVLGHFDEGVEGGANSYNGGSHGNYGYNGTNWAAAFERADTLLNSLTNVGGTDRSGYPTFVILVTDGGPTAGGSGGTTVPGPNVAWTSYRNHYLAAVEDANSIQERENTTLYGIYALGTDANLLDDLMYYANTGEHRTVDGYSIATATQNQHNFGLEEDADNYYGAEDADQLNDAISEIFNQIVEVMGVTEVSMSDGTTSEVTASSGDIVELLGVDEDSYQYWMSIPVDDNNQFRRTKNVDGSAETIIYTVNGGSVTWTEGGESKSVELNGSVKGGQFKFEWTEANDLYEYGPNDAKLVNGAVEWDLSNVGVLLDGVTYSVTFDVYPSQTALDYKARIDNGEAYEDVVDEDLRDFFHSDGTLETNTEGTLTYSDTRDGSGPNTTGFDNPPAVGTVSSSMTVKKEWEGASAPSTELKLDIIMDGDEENPFYQATLTGTSWEATFNISAGMISNGKVLPDAMGHDFSFAELDDTQYRWELHAPTVRPMIIDGAETPTILIKEDKENGYDSTGKTTYEIDGNVYYVDPAVTSLIATNHRRSNLNLTKVVTGDDAPDMAFPFTLVVNNSKAPETEPEDDEEHNSDYWVWFSIRDDEGNYITTDANVSNATQSGDYFYAKSGAEITLMMKDGWNLRFTNLPSGTTYEFTEGDLAGFKFGKAESTGAKDDTFATSGKTATGTVVTYDALAYEVTFTNEYDTVDVTVDKVWDDSSDNDGIRPDTLELTLNGVPDGFEAPDPEITVSEDGNTWTYTWSDLPRYDADGSDIDYTATEKNVPDGYECDEQTASDGGTITNSYEPETDTITVKKVWDDDSDSDGKRPGSVTFTVTGSDGNEYEVTLSGDGDEWTEDVVVQKYYNGGTEVTFTVDEEEVADYEKEIDNDNLTITNSYEPETDTITVTKIWDDNSDSDGKRPDSVIFTVTGSDGSEYEVELSGDSDKWTKDVVVQKYYNGGQEVTFTVDEEDVDGYEKEVDNDNLTITNSYEPETTELKVTKIWDDENDHDGKRPGSVKFTVTGSDGNKYAATLKPAEGDNGNTWTATIKDVAKYYDGGKDVTFTLDEQSVSGYEKSIDNEKLTITNTHTPEKYKITVTKVWVDENNKFGLRPDSVKFTVTGDDENTYEVTLKGTGDTWTAEVEVIKYHDGGKEVEFTVDEEDIVAGYAKDIEGLTITNTFKPWWGDPPVKKEISGDEPAKAETFTFKLKAVSFKKDENSAEDLTGKMPMPEAAGGAQEMTMDVAAGETKEFGKFDLVKPGVYTYTITEVAGDTEGYTYSTEKHTIVYTVTTNEDNSLKCVKTVDGVEIDAEKETDEENVSKFTFTNEYKKPVVSIKVSKVWEDNNNEELTRPESIKVKLYANGKDTGTTLELSKDTEWAGAFEDLDKYDADGKEIKYTVDEAEIPEGYSEVVSGDMTKGFVITNSVVPPTGDTSDIFFWSGLSLSSLLGLGYLFIKRKKEKQ